MIIRYEDLTTRPMSIGRMLFDFLGEPWTDDFVLTGIGRQQLSWMGDNKILKTGGHIAPPEEVWRNWPRELLAALGRKADPLLERLGYPRVT
jgi:hypothetical protein